MWPCYFLEATMRTTLQYVTVSEFRERSGVDWDEFEDITDDMIRDGLRRASKNISVATGEVFLPHKEVVYFDGTGDNLVHHPHLYPFLQLDSLKVVGGAGSSYTLGSNSYSLTDDSFCIQLTPHNDVGTCGLPMPNTDKRFPIGVRNVIMDGIFGWMEPIKSYNTKTRGDIESDTTEVELKSVTNVEKGDILMIGKLDEFESESNDIWLWFEVLTVDHDNRIVTFEPLGNMPNLPIVANTEVHCFGRVPMAVKTATIRAAANREVQGVSDEARGHMGVKSMKTDAFMWTKFTQGEHSASLEDSVTGDIYADNLLDNYLRPPYVGGV
jgi:hypothetical protein